MLCCPVWWWALPLIERNNDETLPIINKSKHPKKGGIYKEQKRKDPRPRKQKNHEKRAKQQGASSS
jgi:hypothetical protein